MKLIHINKQNVFFNRLPEDLVVTSDGIIAAVKINSFLQIIGGSWDNAMRRNEKSHEVFKYFLEKINFFSEPFFKLGLLIIWRVKL